MVKPVYADIKSDLQPGFAVVAQGGLKESTDIFYLAAYCRDAGSADAAQARDMVAKEMTPEQIREAQHLSAEIQESQ